jgi:serine/threonine-protein kinase
VALGKYQAFARLGSGGQADVLLAVAQGPMRFNKLVVLKCLRREVAEHPELVTMFVDEARLAARLSHPNVVHTFEVGEHAGTYFIAMEYLDGQPLNRLMRVRGLEEHLTPPKWAYLISEALAGLHYAHELADYDGTPLQIVHRDVSPHNIFVTYDGAVKLVDFGIAKATVNASRTETGVVKGKAAYMAPEQAYGSPIDRRADIFAMGIVLWEGLTGRRLFEGETISIVLKLVNDEVPRASSVRRGIDPELDAIVARALAKDPAQRWQTADEMREALDAYVRSTGSVIRKAEIGEIVSEAFAELRTAVHAQVQGHMARVEEAASMSRIKLLSPTTLPTALPEIGQPTTPSHVDKRVRALRQLELDEHPSRPPTAPPPRRDALRTWGPPVVGCALLAAALFVWSRGHLAPPAMPAGSALPSSGTTGARASVPMNLTSEPAGARVAWQGHDVGATPLRLDLPLGGHLLTLTRDGFEPETIAVVVAQESPAQIERAVTLRAIAAADAPSSAASAASAKSGAHAPASPLAPPPATATAPSSTSPASPTSPQKKQRPIDKENPFE